MANKDFPRLTRMVGPDIREEETYICEWTRLGDMPPTFRTFCPTTFNFKNVRCPYEYAELQRETR